MFKRHHAWEDLYNRLKGPDWPQVAPPEVDYNFLPGFVKQELVGFGYRPNPYNIQRWHTTGKNKYSVFYGEGHDGGGTGFGTEYSELIKDMYPNRVFEKCYEWCSGPGFIGFDILDHGLAKELCLTDIHNPALECAEQTVDYNNFDNVSIHLLKDLSLLPKHEMFDLVVSNPPHANGFHVEDNWWANENRISSDINWEAHINFYKNIKDHLLPDGVILIQENEGGSTVKDFESMINSANLEITKVFKSPKWYDESSNEYPITKIYYIEIRHRKN